MADNVVADAGSGGATFRTDDDGTAHWPYAKLAWGADNTQTIVTTGASAVPIQDGGNTITVDGTVTANLSATDNAVLDAIAASVAGTLIVDLGANNDVTVTGTVDLGATDNAVLDAIAASVAGTLTVDASGTAVPVTDNSGSLTVDNAGTFAVQESNAHTADFDTGAGTDTTTAFGIAVPANGGAAVVPGDATAGLKVDLGADNDVTVTGTVDLGATDNAVLDAISAAASAIQTAVEGTLTVTGGGGGTEYTEDAAAAADPVGTALILVRADTPAGITSANGDNVAQRGTDYGAAYVTLVNSSGTVLDAIPVTDNAGTLTVDGTVTANLSATDNAVLDSIDTKTSYGSVTGGGVEATALRVTIASDSTGVVSIDDNGGAITIDGSLTNISGTISLPTGAATAANQSTANTALAIIDNPIVAHDAAISGSTGVSVIGFNARSSEPTAVASADATQGLATLLGKQVVIPYSIPASSWSYAAASGGITNTTGVTAKAAAGAGIRNYITRCQVVNGHATVSTDVQIRDGASGTVLWRGFAQAAGGGVTAVFDPPLRGTANTLVEVACGTTGTATYFNLQGFVAAE